MSKLYDYLITAYKVLVGLVTTKRLILLAVGALAFYLLWISFSLMTCFQKKFSKRCGKLYNFIRKNKMNPTNLQVVDMMAEKISSGFYFGWKKFKQSSGKKPSDFITRREALDVEVSGGVLNQGKTLMRSFIAITTAVLFMFNLAYLGADETITSFIIAESMMLPLIYFIVMKMFYFLYTSIKHQLYKYDIQNFYEVIGILDETFGENEVVVPSVNVKAEEVQEDIVEEAALEQTEEAEVLEAEKEEAVIDDNPLRSLDRYDVFKKKNIDVDKIINEIPHNAGTSLPYINVDSDYVIKDEGNVAASLDKIVTDEDNATSILGGMMQDRASLKKNNANFLDVDKKIAEIDADKLEEANKVEEAKQEESVEEKPAESVEVAEGAALSLDQFEVAENATPVETENVTPIDESTEANSVEETKEEPTLQPVQETEIVTQIPEEPVIEEVAAPVEEPVVETPVENAEEVEREAIANVVSGFKTNRSKLASGGVIIERNEPIARRERPVIKEEPVVVTPSVIDDFNDMNTAQSYYQPQPAVPTVQNTVRQLSADNNADNILNSLKSSAGGYDYGYQTPSYETPTYGQGYGYQNNGYVGQSTPNYGAGFGTQSNFGAYQGAFVGQSAPTYGQVNQNPYGESFDAYEQIEDMEEIDDVQEDFAEEEVVSKPAKKIRTKENEPRPRNLKKKVAPKVEENVTNAKTRGRPKKQEVSESMTIKNDKEFNEVLSRAEKLMRKSEEGLSSSQSKRIEKELKMLMDAMSRYKESK